MPRGIRYYAFLGATGYGLSAIAYVRALVNAGVPVQWVPLEDAGRDGPPRPVADPGRLPVVRDAAEDAAHADLPALLARTSAPIACDTVVCHCAPEHWPLLFEPRKRNVGYTTWECDRPPPHWPPILDRADRVLVPCRLNRDAFVAAGTRAPVRVVPHVRRHAWNDFSDAERAAARAQFGIPEGHRVLYSINTWTPRKALDVLLETYLAAFSAADPVTLLLKTSALGSGAPPLYRVDPTEGLARRIVERCATTLGRDRPNVCVLAADDLTGTEIDLLHEIGDCYVSLAHGEGWAIGAFDAATRATPVVMTGWGGHLDFLGPGWDGAVPYRLGPVPVWPPDRPSYFSSQRWAYADADAAARKLRAVLRDDAAARNTAAAIALDIANRYAEPVVARAFIDAIDG